MVQNPDGSIKRDASGKPIGIPAAVREYSDTLLIFLLKGARPEKYHERHQHTGVEGSPLTLVVRSVLQPRPGGEI